MSKQEISNTEHWVNTTLATLITQGKADLQTGPFGTVLKAAEYSERGVPLISVREIRDGALELTPDTPRIDGKTLARLPKYVLKHGDIVFGRKGGVERNAIVNKNQDGWFLGSDGIRLRLSGEMDSKFVSYQVRLPKVQRWLIQNSGGSTMLSLNQKVLGLLPLTFPPLKTQQAIAHILGTIDDKINLNRRMNETLEAMVQAIFKSWFVDFDPVKAKAKGEQPVGMDAETAALFPDSFEPSELGEIPNGWRVLKLKQACSFVKRGLQPKYLEEGGTRVINQRCIRNHWIDFTVSRRHNHTVKKINGRELMPGDVVVNSTGVGTLGRVAQVVSLDETTITDTHVTTLRPNESSVLKEYFGAWAIKNESMFQSMGHGSTGQTELKRAEVEEVVLLVPRMDIQEKYRDMISSAVEKMQINYSQVSVLISLRDTLLPKLISGELSVVEVEKKLEAEL
ncbi:MULTISPECIES: restriction endonuclease subunit S [unclassified Maridesulfovibrio]|uniref:restriction endonuclease subunit S n=1 Tax=unclassified Maridesulfovibrio TaxID=2794999 RepID=UPI003B3C0D87